MIKKLSILILIAVNLINAFDLIIKERNCLIASQSHNYRIDFQTKQEQFIDMKTTPFSNRWTYVRLQNHIRTTYIEICCNLFVSLNMACTGDYHLMLLFGQTLDNEKLSAIMSEDKVSSIRVITI